LWTVDDSIYRLETSRSNWLVVVVGSRSLVDSGYGWNCDHAWSDWNFRFDRGNFNSVQKVNREGKNE